MLPATSAAARDPTFAQEWQRLAQQMGAALAFKHHDIREEARRQQKIAMEQQLEATCAKLPPYWSPVSPELPHEFAGQVVIYDAGRDFRYGQPRIFTPQAAQEIMTHTGLTREAALLALNLKASAAEALQWVEGVLSCGGGVAEAAYKASVQALEEEGVHWQDAEAAMQHCSNSGQLAKAWAKRCRDAGSSAAAEAVILQHLPAHHVRQRIARQYEGGHEVHTVAERFAESASDYFHPTVTRIARVQNPGLADAFQNYCTSCGIPEGELGFRGQVCFHGTSEPAIQSIVQEGFKAEMSRQVQKLIWVASRSSYSHTYSARAAARAAQHAAAAVAGGGGAASALPVTLQHAAACRAAAETSCEYSMIAAAAALPPVDGIQRQGTRQLTACTATFADDRSLYPAYIISYKTPEAVGYY